jgi:DNA-binding MarR family transcriptional regulator
VAQLRDRVMLALRQASAAGVLHGQAVARRIGISPSDLECLDLILLGGPATPGQIGERTGLTSGAVTGLIDRLERLGLVERAPDPTDRRKVLVRVREERTRDIAALFEPMRLAMETLLAGYRREELALLAEFGERAAEVTMRRVEELNRKAG